MIHPTAVIHPTAKLASDVAVSPFAIIEENVTIENHCEIASHAVIKSGTYLSKSVKVESFAIIGGNPQDHGFDPSLKTGVHIGEHTHLREGVTIHRATTPAKPTTVGKNCLLMGYAHLGHDTQVGDNVTIANQTLVSGHVHIEDFVFISGAVAIHQFTRIGESAMIGGHAGVGYDIPPYLMAAKRNLLSGINLVGIKRRGFTQDVIGDIKSCYKAVFLSDGTFEQRLKKALETLKPTTKQGQKFLAFLQQKPHRAFMQPKLTWKDVEE